MRDNAAVGKEKSIALFIMLIMGTLLHGISVAHSYLPAFRKIGSLLALIVH